MFTFTINRYFKFVLFSTTLEYYQFEYKLLYVGNSIHI